LHFFGTSLVIATLLCSLYYRDYSLLVYLPFFGYIPAWIGHFIFEKNNPATFSHPIYSLISDFVMYKDIITGKIKF